MHPIPAIPGLFFNYFDLFNWHLQFLGQILPMLGFEPRFSGIGKDDSTNWATTIAQARVIFLLRFPLDKKWKFSTEPNSTEKEKKENSKTIPKKNRFSLFEDKVKSSTSLEKNMTQFSRAFMGSKKAQCWATIISIWPKQLDQNIIRDIMNTFGGAMV